MLDKGKWFYIVRIGTNERLINKSCDINVCVATHLQKILSVLNRHGNTWMAMSIEDYDKTFGEYKLNSNADVEFEFTGMNTEYI